MTATMSAEPRKKAANAANAANAAAAAAEAAPPASKPAAVESDPAAIDMAGLEKFYIFVCFAYVAAHAVYVVCTSALPDHWPQALIKMAWGCRNPADAYNTPAALWAANEDNGFVIRPSPPAWGPPADPMCRPDVQASLMQVLGLQATAGLICPLMFLSGLRKRRAALMTAFVWFLGYQVAFVFNAAVLLAVWYPVITLLLTSMPVMISVQLYYQAVVLRDHIANENPKVPDEAGAEAAEVGDESKKEYDLVVLISEN